MPEPDPSRRVDESGVRGDVADIEGRPSGCSFRTRCPLAESRCETEEPQLRRVGEGHEVACHFA